MQIGWFIVKLRKPPTYRPALKYVLRLIPLLHIKTVSYVCRLFAQTLSMIGDMASKNRISMLGYRQRTGPKTNDSSTLLTQLPPTLLERLTDGLLYIQ